MLGASHPVTALRAHIEQHVSDPAEQTPRDRPIPAILLKGAVPEGFCTLADIADVFATLHGAKDESDAEFVRVYIDGMLSPRHEHDLLTRRPDAGQPLEAWLYSVFPEASFGIIMNGVERWAPDLARRVVAAFEPLREMRPVPASSYEITLFIGNYGYTPFGIHIDADHTDVVHFHLGPGAKRMTLFDRDTFHRANGPSQRCFDPDTIIDLGTSFDIGAGDVFLLPAHYFHVGCTDGFSVGLAIAVNHFGDAYLRTRAAKNAIEAIGPCEIEKPTEGLPFDEWFSHAIEEDRAREQSRLGLRFSEPRRKDPLPRQSSLRADSLFPVVIRQIEDRLVLHVRGHRLSVLNVGPVERLFRRMLDGSVWTVWDLYGEFEHVLEAEAIDVAAAELWACRGLVAA